MTDTHQYTCVVKVGEQIPDFTVKAYYKNDIADISLAKQRGKWLVLFFYPADFTFVCPTELEEMATLYENFVKEGAEVMSVSTDTHWVHKAWHNESPAIKKIQFPMLADPTGALSRAFGVYIEKEGVALRGTFLIDPTGVIQAMEVHADGVGRSAKELFRKFQAAKFVAEHGGQVCPASWEPGKDTLTPGLELVGKI
ncbi:MAG: redoxin domain-containing protein [Candidatus Pacebacteria bacterium]|nr:redoxin domain-containing protein [Candidatus Paceibacterota bacterium]